MKKLAVLFLGVLAVPSFAQESTQDTPKKLDTGQFSSIVKDPEQLEIEQAVVTRMGAQQDRWFRDGDYPAAIQLLDYEYTVYPFSEDVNTSLGWMYGNTAQYDKEIATYQQFLNANPESSDGPYPLAQYYFLKKNFVMAAHLLAPVVNRKQNSHPNNYRLLAQCYQRLGVVKEALKVYDRYLDFAPNDLTAIAHRNRAARELGVPERVSKSNP